MLKTLIEGLALEYVEVPAVSYDKILSLFRDKVEYIPETAIEYFYLGVFDRHVKKNLDTAIVWYEKANDLNCLEAILTLILIYEKVSINKAIVYYKRVIERGCLNKIVPFAMFLKKVKGNYDEAKAYFSKIRDKDDLNAMCDFCIENDDYIQAEGCCPYTDKIEFYIELADVCRSYDKDDKAESYYKKAFDLNNNDIRPIKKLISFYKKRHNCDQTEFYYKKALELSNKDIEILKGYADFYQDHKKDYNQAEILYKKALEVDDENLSVLSELANFYVNCKIDYDKAEFYYLKTLISDKSSYYTSVGHFYSEIRKNYQLAIFYYKKAISKDKNKNSGVAMNNLAYIYEHNVIDYEQAEVLYKKAIDLKSWVALENLALFYMKTVKMYDQAEIYLNKAITQGHQTCIPPLIELYYLMQKPEKAFLTAHKYNTEDVFTTLNKLTYPISDKNRTEIYLILEKYKFPPNTKVSSDICLIMQDIGFQRQELLCRLAYYFKNHYVNESVKNESN